MAKKDNNWMAEAFKNSKGQLRKATGTKKGDKIPMSKLKEEEKSGSAKNKKRAVLAETARKIQARKK